MKRKLNVQLILLTLCIAIPVVAVIAFLGVRNNQAQRREELTEHQSSVQAQISRIDAMLDLLENSLAYLSIDDSQIRRLANADQQDTQFWLDHNTILRRLENQAMISGLEFTPFLYYPRQGIFYNAAVDPAASAAIRSIADRAAAGEDPQLLDSWSRCSAGEREYLYILLYYQDYFIGAWCAFDDFYRELTDTEYETYIFTDADGKVLLQSGEEFLSSGETVTTGDGAKWYQVAASSSQSDFRLVKLIRKEYLDARLLQVSTYVLIVAGIFALLLLVYIFFLNIWILKPVKHLRRHMEIIRSGDLEHRIGQLPAASEEFQSVAEEFNRLMDSIEELKISIYEGELAQKEVRLEYLSRQIQPHFILNSLNTLYNHSDGDAQTTREMVRLISGYYRYVVNINSPFVELRQELDHIDHYLSLQSLRYPGLFTYEILCGKDLEMLPVPPFIIESFVGNIFKHGFIPGQTNTIRITVERGTAIRKTGEGPESSMVSSVQIRIEDNGEGFSEDSLDAIRDYLEHKIISEELGVGIRNSIERLQLIYQENCGIFIYNKQERGAVVEILLPLEQGGGQEYAGIDC